MRIALVNEGTYPVNTGGVSSWSQGLIERMSEHEFHVVTLVGQERVPVWNRPANLASTTLVPMWDPAPRARRSGHRRQRRRITDAVGRLWRAILPADAGGADLDGLRASLRDLAGGPRPLASLLRPGASGRAVLEAWDRHRDARPHLPALTVDVATEAARHCERVLAALDADVPEVDLIHATSNGSAMLVALARRWADGTPVILSEHGVYLRERYLALAAAGWDWVLRYLVMAFTRALCQLACADADVLAPVSEFNARWEIRLGASADRITVVPNGVEPERVGYLDSEPEMPTVVFLGRIDPLKDLETLIAAFARVHERLPDARLRIFGPTPVGNEGYRAWLDQQVAARGLADVVRFDGPTDGARPALEAGQVIALSSISEGMPFTVIEAMMSGRATVSTDVGGVAECAGRDGTCGIIVPARDPDAMAEALVQLLDDPDRRRRMGLAARGRALERFAADECVDTFRLLYRQLSPVGGHGPGLGRAGVRQRRSAIPRPPAPVPFRPRGRRYALPQVIDDPLKAC
ncbi:MAG: GT4 family glycosyltransferase PelF [Propioniciclava sp.]